MPSFMGNPFAAATPENSAHLPIKQIAFDYSAAGNSTAPTHHVEEVMVVLGGLHLLENELHRLDLVHRIEKLAQNPGLLQDLRLQQQLFATRAALVQQDR